MDSEKGHTLLRFQGAIKNSHGKVTRYRDCITDRDFSHPPTCGRVNVTERDLTRSTKKKLLSVSATECELQ